MKKSLDFKIIDFYKDDTGRSLLINIEIQNLIFTLVTVYAPNDKPNRNTYFKSINKLIAEKRIGVLIVGGDFNDVLYSIDRKNVISTRIIQPANSFKTLIKNNKILDVWREMNKNTQQFTWRRKNKTQSSRIDYIFIDKTFLAHVDKCKIKPACIKSTDHQSVCLTLNELIKDKGIGYWKINNSILADNDYRICISSLIEQYKSKVNEGIIDIRLLWDTLKVEIREATIAFCKSKNKLKNDITKFLETELAESIELQDRFNITDKQFTNKIDRLQSKPEEIYKEKARGAQIRSREKWVEFGEKNNAYFLGLEKQRQSRKSIDKLIKENNTETTNQTEI